jgi:hypothetical protein
MEFAYMHTTFSHLSSDTSSVALILSPPVRGFLDRLALLIKEEVLIELEGHYDRKTL